MNVDRLHTIPQPLKGGLIYFYVQYCQKHYLNIFAKYMDNYHYIQCNYELLLARSSPNDLKKHNIINGIHLGA